MPKLNPRKPEAATEKRESDGATLTSIFQDEQGSVPDLTKLERHRTPWVLIALAGAAAFLVLLTVAAWLGFAVFKPFQGFKGETFQIVVDGPERIALGQETTYFINWQNLASEPLATAEIHVSFPSDFMPRDLTPPPTGDGMVWRLGSVPYGGHGTITIKGIFTGSLGTQTAVQVVGTYRPASFNSDFEALATRSLDYADTVLDGVLVVPPKSLPGDKIRITYNLQNRGSVPLKALQARITMPEGFVRDASSSASELDGSVVPFAVGDLASGATSSISLTGSFASGSSGNAVVHAEVGRLDAGGAFQPALKTEATLEVLSGDLNLNLVVNGSTTDRSVAYGDMLRVAIGYENTATEDVKDVTVRLRLEPIASASGTATVLKNALDWTQLDDASSGTVAGNVVAWDKKGLGVLERLPPQNEGSIELSVPVVGFATGTSGLTGFQLVAEATMASVGDTIVNRTIRTSPIIFRFRTDADIAREARYFSEEGAPLGSGPLPPTVGQTTTYRLGWTITKHTHELKDLRVSALLPKSVSWPNNVVVSAGDMSYDEASRTVTWSLNRLPADVNEATADFDVQLTPSVADAGRFADLLGETRFQATDVQISEPIVRTKPGLSTDLQNDEGAKSKGVVKKP